LLLALSVAAGVLVFASVLQYTSDVARQLGPRRDVLVLVRPATALQPISQADVEVRSVPEVFSPPQALGAEGELQGKVPLADLSVGSFIDENDLIPTPALGFGEREVTLLSNAERTFGATVRANDRVDLVVTRTTATSSGQAVTTTWRIRGSLVLGVSGWGDPAGAAVRLAVPREQAVRLAEERTRGADVYLVRVPLSEVTS
jgi:Flp pilus assembly protein CpaB